MDIRFADIWINYINFERTQKYKPYAAKNKPSEKPQPKQKRKNTPKGKHDGIVIPC